ncbi:MAG: CBS domain-containing protein [Myxococcales bacterium]|nr:MAG: CBS domain-containing protein [Myxococcales bacterium]
MPIIQDILDAKGSEVATISPEATIYEALRVLVEKHIGSLVVTDEEKVAGLISERDILRTTYERPEEIKTLRVSEFMTTELFVGMPKDDLDLVMMIMTEQRFRHLPIISDGQLVGIISIGDVVKALKDQSDHEKQMLTDYVSGTYPT